MEPLTLKRKFESDGEVDNSPKKTRTVRNIHLEKYRIYFRLSRLPNGQRVLYISKNCLNEDDSITQYYDFNRLISTYMQENNINNLQIGTSLIHYVYNLEQVLTYFTFVKYLKISHSFRHVYKSLHQHLKRLTVIFYRTFNFMHFRKFDGKIRSLTVKCDKSDVGTKPDDPNSFESAMRFFNRYHPKEKMKTLNLILDDDHFLANYEKFLESFGSYECLRIKERCSECPINPMYSIYHIRDIESIIEVMKNEKLEDEFPTLFPKTIKQIIISTRRITKRYLSNLILNILIKKYALTKLEIKLSSSFVQPFETGIEKAFASILKFKSLYKNSSRFFLNIRLTSTSPFFPSLQQFLTEFNTNTSFDPTLFFFDNVQDPGDIYMEKFRKKMTIFLICLKRAEILVSIPTLIISHIYYHFREYLIDNDFFDYKHFHKIKFYP